MTVMEEFVDRKLEKLRVWGTSEPVISPRRSGGTITHKNAVPASASARIFSAIYFFGPPAGFPDGIVLCARDEYG